MEHEIHSVYSLFWRNAYVAALQAGHPDPAAAADEAFMAFDCRFGEVEKEPTLPSSPTCYTVTYLDAAGREVALPLEHGWQAGHVVGDPSTEGLPPPAEKSDDEVLG